MWNGTGTRWLVTASYWYNCRESKRCAVTTIDEDQQEAGVPELAVKALTAAQHRAAAAGHPLVLVRNGWLVRVLGSNTVFLKELPPRRKVSVRTKQLGHD